MLREHQLIVGTATAQLPEMLISHKRTKIRRVPKVTDHLGLYRVAETGVE